ncbi:hypothetical protein EYC84_008539 [Monilinia fructicola]|uniref:Uncharacterized protein n=1 Tax=Monilinia fructicola TaxID=38448 RepID=A0A5M9JHK7_MONFR|nr:hypothetical protein EYC84_008539 [Monilinia fructicola]
MSSSLFSSLAPFESDHPNNFTFDHMKRSLISSRRVQLIKKTNTTKTQSSLPSIHPCLSISNRDASLTNSKRINSPLEPIIHRVSHVHRYPHSLSYITAFFGITIEVAFAWGGRGSCGGVDNFPNWMRIREVEKGD